MTPDQLMRAGDALCVLDRRLDPSQRAHITTLAHGRTFSELRFALLAAANPECIRSAAELLAANEGGCACSGDEPPEPTASQLEAAADRLSREALAPFVLNRALSDYLRSLGFGDIATPSAGLSPT